MSRPTYLLRIPHGALRHHLSIPALLRRQQACRAPSRARVAAYEMAADEHAFARSLSDLHRRFWLYRSHQRMFCGDFAVVDMSARDLRRRRAWLIDLKRGSALRIGGGGAGNQLINAAQAGDELVHAGVIATSTELCRIVGDRTAILSHVTTAPTGAHSC